MFNQEVLDKVVCRSGVIMQVDAVTRIGLYIRLENACFWECGCCSGRDRRYVWIAVFVARSAAEYFVLI